MLPPLRLLLDGIIDYAGLFPPAKLDMGAAARELAAIRSGANAWIVDRFVCPCSRLEELSSVVEGLAGFPPFEVSAVGTGGVDLDQWETNLESDARSMTEFERRMEGRASIGGFEIRVPADGNLAAAIRDLRAFQSADVFLEVPMDEGLEDALAAIAETEWLGAKGRTGGLNADAVPSPLQLARFLRAAIDLEAALKLTAGLHEPWRHHDPAVGAEVHGFMNVLLGSLAHRKEDLASEELADILRAKEEPVTMRHEEIEFRGMRFGHEDIEELRELFRGFGSCSVEEPLEGLRRCGWMEETV